MVPDRLPVYDRPELAPKVRYQEPVATPRNHEMLPRKAKRLLILNHEIGNQDSIAKTRLELRERGMIPISVGKDRLAAERP
jgi:hypothetical protein